MRTVGIIVEYNPLHNGHVYHFQQSRSVSGADAVVAVMSGHFLQRGEPALVNKWARTEMALRMGADVVIELPAAYSSQPAEWFAFGAVSALHASGIVDDLCFGSESGDIGWLTNIAELLAEEPEHFHQLLQLRLKRGMNYPAAYTQTVQELARKEDVPGTPHPYATDELSKPNNTLGLHYLIALRRLNSGIRPLTITRSKAGYHEPTVAADSNIASATAIRRLILEESGLDAVRPYVPPCTMDILRRELDAGRAPIHWEKLARPLYQSILGRSKDQLAGIAELGEGLENRLLRALAELRDDWSVERLIALLKTRRYTRTKLQRVLTRVLLGHRKDTLSRDILARGVPYLRILGFSRKGQLLLKRMRRQAAVPVITNVGRNPDAMLQLDIQATGIYSLAYRELHSNDVLRDYYEPPIQLVD